MLQYILRRLLVLPVILLLVTLILFVLILQVPVEQRVMVYIPSFKPNITAEEFQELESKLSQCRARVKELEAARDELNAKLKKAAKKKPPVKKPVDSRSRAAAISIMIIGALVWIASDN